MSRHSLRLDEGLLDRSLPHSSASFSVGGASWRSNRSLKPRHSRHLLSSSCASSQPLSSPVKESGPSRPRPEGGGGLGSSSVASDASLLSSLLDESSVQESTLVGSFWGLDADVDPKESTALVDQSVLVPDALKHQYRSSETGTSTVYCRDRGLRSKTGVLWFPLWVRRAAAGCVRVLTHTWQVCRELCSQANTQTENRHGARPGLCGVMDLKGPTRDQRDLKGPTRDQRDLKGPTRDQRDQHPEGSLCDGCQEKPSSSSSSSLASCLWSAAGFTGAVFRWLDKRWRHMTSSFLLTGVPLRLLLVLLPLLLLLFSLCWFGPAMDVSETGTLVSGFLSFRSRPAGGAGESRPDGPPPAAGEEVLTPPQEEAQLRLGRLEESQAALWQHVEAGGQRAEQRHTEVLQLYADLQQLVSDQNHREEPWTRDQQLVSDQNHREEPWTRDQLDLQLSGGPGEDSWQTEKQQSQTSRLDQLELQLQALAARTQEASWRREAASTVSPSTLPDAVGGAVDPPSHDALLAEVARLAAAMEDVRRDVQGLSGVLDGIQSTVREEVRVLVYGNQLTAGGGASGEGGGAPESLLQQLSLRCVSSADLQGALASLELKILQNLSMDQHRRGEEEEQKVREEEEQKVREVLHATEAAVTQEDVRDIVSNALRLFSQDRIGLADFALESGGGSVLNTRCSQTHQAKVALYSLFGVPLWYFSQSPRAVIQPDVHPGNCWAFRGSAGFLVIRLSARIRPSSFSLEHLPKALAPSRGGLSSAPRDFTVHGLVDEDQQGGKLLGSFTYDEAGEALQTFRVTEENHEAFQVIEVQVLSNWGHQEYTCLYRFRAHGTPEEEEEPGEEEEEEEKTSKEMLEGEEPEEEEEEEEEATKTEMEEEEETETTTKTEETSKETPEEAVV